MPIARLAAVTSLALALLFSRSTLGQADEANAKPALKFATLSRAVDCKWEAVDGVKLEEGARLGACELVLKDGLAEVKFDNGAKVILRGPAEFVIESASGGFLRRGQLVADVPDDLAGFKVDTPSARIVHKPREFGVAVARTGNTEVHVFRGEVGLEQGEAGPKFRLSTGQGARLAPRKPRLAPQAPARPPAKRDADEPADKDQNGRPPITLVGEKTEASSDASKENKDSADAEKTKSAAARRPVARLGKLIDCRWAEDHTLATEYGEALTPGLFHLLEGSAEIAIGRHGRVTIEGPAILEIDSQQVALLHEGKVTAQLASFMAGFALQTPEVVAIGRDSSSPTIEFSLQVVAGSRTEVSVSSGAVNARRAGGVEERIGPGQSRTFLHGEMTLDQLPGHINPGPVAMLGESLLSF